MVYTTYLWWFGGWFIIVLPTLIIYRPCSIAVLDFQTVASKEGFYLQILIESSNKRAGFGQAKYGFSREQVGS